MTETQNDDQLLGMKEVCGRLGVTDRTVRRMIHRGDLPAYVINGKFRIEKRDLEAYLAASKYEPEAS